MKHPLPPCALTLVALVKPAPLAYCANTPRQGEQSRHAPAAGLRAVVLYEAAKAALVLVAGLGVLGLWRTDLQAVVEQLVRQCHLDPASHYPRIFHDLAAQVTTPHLLMLAGGALVYSVVHLVEAWGLWRERRWAEWLAVIGCGLYLTLEMVELACRVTWACVLRFLVNLTVVGYLARILAVSRRSHTPLYAVSQCQL